VWQLPRASGYQIRRMMDALESVAQAPRDEILGALRKYLPEYQPGVPADGRPGTLSMQRPAAPIAVAA
jgi:hypothetical protein